MTPHTSLWLTWRYAWARVVAVEPGPTHLQLRRSSARSVTTRYSLDQLEAGVPAPVQVGP